MTNIRVYELQFIDSGTRTRGAERPEVLVVLNFNSTVSKSNEHDLRIVMEISSP